LSKIIGSTVPTEPASCYSPLTHRNEENSVKIVTLAALLLLSAPVWAGGDPNPAEYTVNVHVSSSSTAHYLQELNVVIDGKHYNLESETTFANRLLALGDYKAKLAQDQHTTAYDSYQVYEFLFPDKKTRKFIVVGQTE
jgi:hypothetical protein